MDIARPEVELVPASGPFVSRAPLIAPKEFRLYGVLGGKSRVSEFFAGKRELSMNQVRALREMLGIPADLLI